MLDIDGRVRMSQRTMDGPGGTVGFSCGLPIPFAKGTAIDYQRMTVDQLQRFILFMYRSQYKTELPSSSSNSIKPPAWWPENVSFEKSLKLKTGTSQKAPTPRLQKELASLIQKCYEYHGVPSILAMGQELANHAGGYTFQKTSSSVWKVVDTAGRTIIMLDTLTRTYDSNNKDRPVFFEKESQENAEVAQCGKRPPNRQSTNVSSKTNSKRGPAKRKIVYDSGEEDTPESFTCQYCNKLFRAKDFCEEHQSDCINGPAFSQLRESQVSFMDVLGMRGKTTEVQSIPKSLPNEPISTRSRSTRKLPKKHQLLNAIKSNPIPLTCELGKRLVRDLEGKGQYEYPPEYEKLCEPKSGLPIQEKEYPSNTKRAILKNGEHPHIYSCGRRQRAVRYQELVIGVSRNSWGLLNSCKQVKITTEKLDPRMKTIVVPAKIQRTSYLERKWEPALTPRVRLVDFRKHLTDDIRQLLPANVINPPKPGGSKAKSNVH